MYSINHTFRLRRYVFIAIFAYACQMLSVSVHAFSVMKSDSESSSMTSSPCHDAGQTLETGPQIASDNAGVSASCCDGGCPMMGCHAAPVLIYPITHFFVARSSTWNVFFHPARPIHHVNSPYRPPILG